MSEHNPKQSSPTVVPVVSESRRRPYSPPSVVRLTNDATPEGKASHPTEVTTPSARGPGS